MESSCEEFVLQEILKNEKICTFFQPIVSLKTGEIFAYEALVRGLRDNSTQLIPPCELFRKAETETISIEFDRLCRKKALESFKKFHSESLSMMFMNIMDSDSLWNFLKDSRAFFRHNRSNSMDMVSVSAFRNNSQGGMSCVELSRSPRTRASYAKISPVFRLTIG